MVENKATPTDRPLTLALAKSMEEDTTIPLESNQPEESNNLDMEETTEELQSNDITVDPQDDTTVDPQDEILEEPSRPMSHEKKSGKSDKTQSHCITYYDSTVLSF